MYRRLSHFLGANRVNHDFNENLTIHTQLLSMLWTSFENVSLKETLLFLLQELSLLESRHVWSHLLVLRLLSLPLLALHLLTVSASLQLTFGRVCVRHPCS
ncbi:hypothetical protein VNO78_25753 [Psophocarpus tetragonolobus]|uniref:Uncharacterized protein n=1 Tax=Psophocarpus tetragonolobus TaxID=3891 RepID=A0AAN9XF95_PSOTE